MSFNSPWGNNNYGSFSFEDEDTKQNEYSGFGGVLKAMGEISSSVAPVLKFIPDFMNSTARLKEAGRYEDTARQNSENQQMLQKIVEYLHYQQQDTTQLRQEVEKLKQAVYQITTQQIQAAPQLLALPAPTNEDSTTETNPKK